MSKFKTPSKIQVEPIECGAVATWIILGYYNKWLSTEEARTAVNVTKDGSTAFNIATALRNLNCDSEGFQPTIDELKQENPECRYPCIAWVKKIHWIVIEKFDGKDFLISDPAKGYRKVNPEDFAKEYSGLVISAWPNENFEESGKAPNPYSDLLDLVKEYKFSLILYVIVGFAETIPTITLSSYVGYFTDTLLEQKDLTNSYIWLLALIVGISFLFNYLQKIVMRRLHLAMLTRLIERTFQKLISLPITFYPLRDLGEISQRITLNINLSNILTGSLAGAIVGVMTMLIYLVIMLSYNWILGLVVLGLGLFIFKALISVASSLSQLSQKSSMAQGKQTSNVLYMTQNFNSIKANGQETALFQQWCDNFEESLDANTKKGLIEKRNTATTLYLNQLSNYLIVILSGIFILTGKLSLGEFLSFRMIAQAFLAPINTLSGVNAQFSSAVGDVNRLKDLWEAEDDKVTIREMREIENDDKNKIQKLTDSNRQISSNPKIEISNLSYKFTPNSEPIFNSVNLDITEGDVISLTGPPGSGKTTLLQCFSCLLDSDYDKFNISDTDIKDFSSISLRKSIAYVSQSQYIYDATVLDNLRVFDKSISVENILKTIDFFHLDGIFNELSDGLSTSISQISPTSKTTKNSIHLLRALIRQPRILLIDDVLSQFSSEESLKLINSIISCVPIVVFVSKNPDIISFANRSLVLNKGNLVEVETSNLIKNIK